MANFEQFHQFGEYRDFEPVQGIAFAGYSRITFNDDKHTAYATLANPAATLDNDETTYTDETKELTWDEAIELVG